MEEISLDTFEENIVDDAIFTGATITQTELYKYLNISIPPDGLARNLFHTIIRLVYDVIPKKDIDLIGYAPLDKFFVLLGPQLIFTSMYSRSNLAALSDTLNLLIILMKDIIAEKDLYI